MSQQLAISPSSITRILTNDLRMFPYKIHIHQSLSKYAKDVRVAFYGPVLQFLQGNPAVL
jgi:hypothetical protein